MSIWFWIAIGLALLFAYCVGLGYSIDQGKAAAVHSVRVYGAFAHGSERIEGPYKWAPREVIHRPRAEAQTQGNPVSMPRPAGGRQ